MDIDSKGTGEDSTSEPQNNGSTTTDADVPGEGLLSKYIQTALENELKAQQEGAPKTMHSVSFEKTDDNTPLQFDPNVEMTKLFLPNKSTWHEFEYPNFKLKDKNVVDETALGYLGIKKDGSTTLVLHYGGTEVEIGASVEKNKDRVHFEISSPETANLIDKSHFPEEVLETVRHASKNSNS